MEKYLKYRPPLPADHWFMQEYDSFQYKGKGSMGIVFRCREKATSRIIAVKFLHTAEEDLSASIKRKFQREFNYIKKINHPQIIEVYDFIETPPFFTMEYLEGCNLKSYLAELKNNDEPLKMINSSSSQKKIANIARNTLTALGFIHYHRIVHRDLKPGNIFVLDEFGNTKLLDFGLVKPLDLSLTSSQSNEIVGTPIYISPEQIINKRVDYRSDLYSFGVVLFEMFTGKFPFESDKPIHVLQAHIEDEPPSPDSLNPEIPPILNNIILRLLEKDPGERFQSSEEVLSALKTCLPAFNGKYAPGPAIPSPSRDITLEKFPQIFHPRFISGDNIIDKLTHIVSQRSQTSKKVIFIQGESGIGKTRLMKELSHSFLFEKPKTLFAEGIEDNTVPHYPFSMLIDSVLPLIRKLPGNRRTKIFDEVNPVVMKHYFPNFSSAIIPVSDEKYLPLKPRDEQLRLCDMVSTLLIELSKCSPFLICLDDIHLFDRNSLELLDYFMKRITDEGHEDIVILCSYSRENLHDNQHLRNLLHTYEEAEKTELIDLKRLSKAEVGMFLRSILGMSYPPLKLAEEIHRESQGNPLFIEEIVQTMIEEGILYKIGSSWRIKGPGPRNGKSLTEKIPFTIQQIVLNRFNKLNALEKKILNAGAAAGKYFLFEALQNCLEFSETEILSALDSLIRKYIIEESTSNEAGYAFQFYHEKFREVVYSRLSASEKREYHRKIADSLNALNKNNKYEIPEEILAEHYLNAEHARCAVMHSLRAAKEAALHNAPERAVYFYDQILSLFGKELSSQKRTQIYLDMAMQEWLMNMTESSESHFRKVLSITRKPSHKIKALLGLARIHQQRLEKNQALRHLVQAQNSAEKHQMNKKIKGEIIFNLAEFHSEHGELKKSVELCRQGLSMLQKSKHHKLLSGFRVLLGCNLGSLGQLNEAEKLIMKGFHTAKKKKYIYELLWMYNALFFIHWNLKRHDEATKALREGLALAEENHCLSAALQIKSNLGFQELKLGEYKEAEELLTSCIEISKKCNEEEIIIKCYNDLGLTYSYLGNFKEAENFLKIGLKKARQVSNDKLIFLFYDNLGSLALKNRNLEQAEKYLNSAKETADQVGDESYLAFADVHMAAVHTEYGRYRKAEELIDKAQEIFSIVSNPEGLMESYFYQAELLKKQNELKAAEATYLKLQGLSQELRSKYRMGLAWRGLAEIQHLKEKPDAAYDNVNRAIKIFKKLAASRELILSYKLAADILEAQAV